MPSTEAPSQSQPPGSKGPVVCVFCGSSPGTNPAHLAAARSLAQTFHKHGITLVYGGGTVGLMGELARHLVSLSGPDSVHGIIPRALVKYEQQGRGKPPPPPVVDAENNNTKSDKRETDTGVGSRAAVAAASTTTSYSDSGIDEQIYGRTTIVSDMHTRKNAMAQLVLNGGPGSGFVGLSGGYGTLEELFEITTWNQLGIHDKGVVVFNVEGYYDGILAWVRNAVEAGFVGEGNRGIMVEAREAEEVVRALREYKAAEGRFKLEWGEK
ncbi:hypothetical protein MMC25_001296 [Agyrium rufum]|nr:hypothetical protein [Agyrium rufum]